MNYFCNCDADIDSWYVDRESLWNREHILGAARILRPSQRDHTDIDIIRILI